MFNDKLRIVVVINYEAETEKLYRVGKTTYKSFKMKKFNLSSLERANVSGKQMDRLRGGYEKGDCTCGCLYEGQPGGSTLQDNGDANYDGGFHTHGVTNGYVRSVTKTATKTTTQP